MTHHLISSSALIAAEDAYDEVATESFEQINRGALEKSIKAYLACDPALADAIEALRSIAAGEGYYGAQATEYKATARAALRRLGVSPI